MVEFCRREYEVAKLRVADAAERVRRLKEIVAKLEEDPMLLVPEEVDTDGEEEEEGEQEQRGGEEEGGVKAETSRVAENGEVGEKNEVSYPVLIARGVDTNHISDRMRKILLLVSIQLLRSVALNKSNTTSRSPAIFL